MKIVLALLLLLPVTVFASQGIVKVLLTSIESNYAVDCPETASKVIQTYGGYENDWTEIHVYKCGSARVSLYFNDHEFTKKRHLTCFDIVVPSAEGLMDNDKFRCRDKAGNSFLK